MYVLPSPLAQRLTSFRLERFADSMGTDQTGENARRFFITWLLMNKFVCFFRVLFYVRISKGAQLLQRDLSTGCGR